MNMKTWESPIETGKKEKPNLKYILEKTNEIGSEMTAIYTNLHENPELGGEEVETAKKVVAYLESLGIEIIGKHIGKTESRGGEGVVARIKGKEGGPVIALRADMDALPMEESEDNVPRSKNKNVMHGCGHDTHTTSLMGAAKVLKGLADRGELEGDVLLMFQSSEEKAHQKESGAVQIVKFLEKNKLREDIKSFFGLHVFAGLERGEVQLKEGTQLASSGEVDIILRTPQGHIVNVYDKTSLHRIFSKLTLRLEEKFKPKYEQQEALVGSARTVYEGSAYNVLPVEGKSTWVVRVISPEYKKVSKEIVQEIKQVLNEIIAEEPGNEKVDIEIKKRPGYRPVVHRDPALVKIASESAKEVIDNYNQIEKVSMGGEDYSFYLESLGGKEIPGVFACVGAGNPEKGYPKANHHSEKFKVDPDVLKDMIALYSNYTVNAMEHFKTIKQ
jgi:amidohydrolase